MDCSSFSSSSVSVRFLGAEGPGRDILGDVSVYGVVNKEVSGGSNGPSPGACHSISAIAGSFLVGLAPTTERPETPSKIQTQV